MDSGFARRAPRNHSHRFLSTMSFAAIRPPPAIKTAAMAMLALALAKPAAA